MSNKNIGIWRGGSLITKERSDTGYNPEIIYLTEPKNDVSKGISGTIYGGNKKIQINRGVDLQDLLTGLVVYYRLDGNTLDSSGNGYDGIPTSDHYYPNGKLNQSLNGGIISSGPASQLYNIDPYTQDFSMMMWFYINNISGSAQFHLFNLAEEFNPYLIANSDTSISNRNIQLFWGEAQEGYTVVSENLNTGWYHIAAVFKGGIAKSYLNGILMTTNEVAATGGNLNGLMYGFVTVSLNQRSIDEISVYNIALTHEQILRSYNNGIGFDPTV